MAQKQKHSISKSKGAESRKLYSPIAGEYYSVQKIHPDKTEEFFNCEGQDLVMFLPQYVVRLVETQPMFRTLVLTTDNGSTLIVLKTSLERQRRPQAGGY